MILISDSLIINLSARLQALEEGDLLITSTTTADTGKYTCIRANDAGHVSGEAFLTVLGNLKMYLHICWLFWASKMRSRKLTCEE